MTESAGLSEPGAGAIAGGPRRSLRRISDRWSSLPLRLQIGTLVALGLVGIFVPFGILGFEIADDGKRQTLGDWSSITTTTASYIDAQLEQQFGRLERVATLVGRAQADPKRQRQILQDEWAQPEAFVTAAFLLDRASALSWSTSSTIAASDVLPMPDEGVALASGARYASGMRRIGEQPAVVLAVPVRGADGAAIGSLGVVLRPDEGVLRDLVRGARGLAHTGHAELVDQFDRVIASTEAADVLGPGEHPDFYDPHLADRTSAVGLTAPIGPNDPADQGQRHDMAFVPLRSVPWGLALGGSDSELSANANRWQRQIVVLAALTLALALLLVWFTTRSVAQPVLALAAASRQIAGGDLTTPVPLEGEGEVRVLAQAFDHMRSELQRARSALALEESRYEGIVASMADAVITTDLGLRVTALNPAAATLTGWGAEEAVGRLWCEVVCTAHASPADCDRPCSLARPDRDARARREALRTRDGRAIQVAITDSAVHDETGRLAGTVHVLRDVSAEAEIERLKDDFLSTVSHELRTPIGFIMGYATTLLLPDAPRDEDVRRRCIQVIADASGELEELVGNLLDMTRIGARSLAVSPRATLLAPLVRAAVERTRMRGPAHRFSTALSRALPPVLADPHRLEQVLYNLLDNAIKYSPDGGPIAVRASATATEVTVSVVDAGLGIAADELPTLFERFHRGHLARSRGIAGTGLGLAICRGIVEAHGGRIWVESPPADDGASSHGTAIRFTLPLAAVEACA